MAKEAPDISEPQLQTWRPMKETKTVLSYLVIVLIWTVPCKK